MNCNKCGAFMDTGVVCPNPECKKNKPRKTLKGKLTERKNLIGRAISKLDKAISLLDDAENSINDIHAKKSDIDNISLAKGKIKQAKEYSGLVL